MVSHPSISFGDTDIDLLEREREAEGDLDLIGIEGGGTTLGDLGEGGDCLMALDLCVVLGPNQ